MASISFSGAGFDAVTHDLTRFRQNITKAKPALENMAEHVAGMQRDQFTTQGRHYGPAWAPLSPKYKAWKAKRRPGKKILQFDGNLKSQAAPSNAKQFGIYGVTDKRMEVGVDYQRTPYAQHHQEGGKHLPARPIIGQPTREDQKAMTKILHEHIIKGAGLARR